MAIMPPKGITPNLLVVGDASAPLTADLGAYGIDAFEGATVERDPDFDILGLTMYRVDLVLKEEFRNDPVTGKQRHDLRTENFASHEATARQWADLFTKAIRRNQLLRAKQASRKSS